MMKKLHSRLPARMFGTTTSMARHKFKRFTTLGAMQVRSYVPLPRRLEHWLVIIYPFLRSMTLRHLSIQLPKSPLLTSNPLQDEAPKRLAGYQLGNLKIFVSVALHRALLDHIPKHLQSGSSQSSNFLNNFLSSGRQQIHMFSNQLNVEPRTS